VPRRGLFVLESELADFPARAREFAAGRGETSVTSPVIRSSAPAGAARSASSSSDCT